MATTRTRGDEACVRKKETLGMKAILIGLLLALSAAHVQQSAAQTKHTSLELFDAASKADKTALQGLRTRAQQGDADAQYYLGELYRDGKGVPKDSAQAVQWYTKAADRGHVAAQSDLGSMYFYGQGVPKDSAQAVQWYRKAAEQGDTYAQYNLGF